MFPAAYLLWLRRYQGDHSLTLMMLSMPILWSYTIPALGMNWLRLWEFHTRFKIGRIRPHHGFMFGSATSLFGLLCVDPTVPPVGTGSALRAGLVLGSVVAFWNWLYDLHAIRVGFVTVYNRKYHEGCGPGDISTDYAPVIFGMFGFCYGIMIRVAEAQLMGGGCDDRVLYWSIFVGGNLMCLVVPVLSFLAYSYCMLGESGLHSYEGDGPGAR